MTTRKKILYFFILPIFLVAIFFTNYQKIVRNIPQSFKSLMPKSMFNLHGGIKFLDNIRNMNPNSEISVNSLFYNMLLLPQTQYGQVNFTDFSLHLKDKVNVEFKPETDQFHIAFYKDKLILVTYSGNLFSIDPEQITNESSQIIITPLKNNFKDLKNIYRVLDLHIDNDELLISFAYLDSLQNNKECFKTSLARSEFNENFLDFKKIFSTRNCSTSKTFGGAVGTINSDESSGYLIASANQTGNPLETIKTEDSSDDYGKIFFVDKATLNKSIYSIGHRNPQGMHIEGRNIIVTEHGPRGGDEINFITKGANYGWPTSSYGTKYVFGMTWDKKYLSYKKSHEKYNFNEPIFSFVPSIGISRIIKLPNNFWQESPMENLYLLSSLHGNSLYQIKLDSKLNKVLFVEKIFTGKRIRDLALMPGSKKVFIAFEKPGSIAILEPI